jgi:hypothetical protein
VLLQSVNAVSGKGFSPGVTYDVGTYPISMAISDLDGDGKMDLAVANMHSNDVSILRGCPSTS